LQYEIVNNPHTVDLLVSLAYTAAIENSLQEPPIGMALRVPHPISGTTSQCQEHSSKMGEDDLCEFDDLTLPEVWLLFLTSCMTGFSHQDYGFVLDAIRYRRVFRLSPHGMTYQMILHSNHHNLWDSRYSK
jgi:hypothetical protein